MNDLLNGLREGVLNYSITSLFPAQRCLLDEYWSVETGFADEESEEFFGEICNVAEELIERGDRTGIPHFVLFQSAMIIGISAERQGDEKLQEGCIELANKYIHESIDLNFNLACFEMGNYLFWGNGLWDKDEEAGIKLLKKALELPILPELGFEPEFIHQMLQSGYDECMSQYSKTKKSESTTSDLKRNMVATQKQKNLKRNKLFTAKYYIGCLAAFIGYILISIIVRNEFGLHSAYDISISNNPLIGIGVTLLLNYSIIPLLMMAYFYKRNNGKHNVFFVGSYIAFLALCVADGILPYLNGGDHSFTVNLGSFLLYPIIFIVSHRLLSLLIYAIISRKEGDSDYKIYFGIALFAPFMAWIFAIAIVFWFFQLFSGGDGYSPSSYSSSESIKDSIHNELDASVRNSGVYYDEGWKVVDYWNNSASLSEVSGAEWGYTYLKDSKGKVYVLPTNCPDKESVYYFN